MAEPLVDVRGVRKEYMLNPSLIARMMGRTRPSVVLDDVSLTISRGETLGLVGESGSGKSTLARCIMQLEDVTAGEIRFDGQALRGAVVPAFRKRAQIVFQDPQSSINRALRISEILASPLQLHGNFRSRAARRDRIAELLSLVGLPASTMERWPHQLSGGQRQRIGIARALAVEPDFIVLDEPTSALDVSIQAQVINLLEDLQKRLSLTYLFISHDLRIVRYLCDRLAVMKQGQLVEVGECEAVFAKPAHPYTQQLLAATHA